MLTSVRSVRATSGRMSTAAQASMRALTGKRRRYCVPSVLRTLAIASGPFMALVPCGTLLVGAHGAVPEGGVVLRSPCPRATSANRHHLAGRDEPDAEEVPR